MKTQNFTIQAEDKGIITVVTEGFPGNCPNKVCDIYYTDKEDSSLTLEEAVDLAMSVVLEIKRLA